MVSSSFGTDPHGFRADAAHVFAARVGWIGRKDVLLYPLCDPIEVHQVARAA